MTLICAIVISMKEGNADANERLLQRAWFYGRFFKVVPFLECFILNGSVAEGRAKAGSDIDVLVIAKQGRIYTVRFLVLLIAMVLGIKRSKDESKDHAGKFCFNFFLVSNYLLIFHKYSQEQRNRYCAKNYSQSVLLWGDGELFDRFMRENEKWWGRYLTQESKVKSQNLNLELKTKEETVIGGHSERCNFGAKNLGVSRTLLDAVAKGDLDPSLTLRMTRKVVEIILSGKFGNFIEKILKRIQIRSIEKDSRTYAYPELIAYNDNELRFHPPKW